MRALALVSLINVNHLHALVVLLALLIPIRGLPVANGPPTPSPSVCLPACLPGCLSTCLPTCLPAWLLVYLHACVLACSVRACLPACLCGAV